MKLQFKSKFTVLLVRLLVVYIAFMLCRLFFYFYNNELIDAIEPGQLWSLLRGSLMFDTVSVIYLNLPFCLLALFPFHIDADKRFRKAMLAIFMLFNGIGLLVNVADIFYYPFKQARIVLGDMVLLKEDSMVPLLGDFLVDYWYGFVFYIALLIFLYRGYNAVQYNKPSFVPAKRYFAVNFAWLAVMSITVAFFVRGATFSEASYPIGMNDAFWYTDNPTHTSVVLSNPFCLLRTMGKSGDVPNLHYFDDALAENIAPTTHMATDTVAFEMNNKTNVFIIVLESFGKSHIKSLSDQFDPKMESNTPFLDSLINESYVFTNAHQNGFRSIDALPAIWASIPSFKQHFLSLPNSVASYHALPACMNGLGYQTAFFHGGVRESMGFVSFGKTAGIKEFYSREEYEEEMGPDDFDGKWGIWDHKFMPYVHKKLNLMYGKKKPFFATLFTLSSHHPFKVPPGLPKQFSEGTLPIHRAIKYSDYALGELFKEMEKEPWYNNTLFIITADHSSGSDNEKFNKAPHNYTIPILFFKPGSGMKGKDDRIMQHIDIMPTLLGMLDYEEPFFAFGKDHFDRSTAKNRFAVNFSNSAFNFITDKYYYLFNEKEVITKTDYRKDPFGKNNMISALTPEDEAAIKEFKAFLQEYYFHVNNRNYLPHLPAQNSMANVQGRGRRLQKPARVKKA